MGSQNHSQRHLENGNTSYKTMATVKRKVTKRPELSTLLKNAVTAFHEFIRERDKNRPCISCGRHVYLQAGHFFPAGHYSALRFNEDNVHGQCVQCNFHKHGNLTHYEINLRRRIGDARVDALILRAQIYKRSVYKWQRIFLEQIIEQSKTKLKLLKQGKQILPGNIDNQELP
jgi:5-methylcytosine-specific restriction endonuclease McrA